MNPEIPVEGERDLHKKRLLMKQLIRAGKDLSAAYVYSEKEKEMKTGAPYDLYDSPLDSVEMLSVGPRGFNQSFERVLDGCDTIPEYLNTTYPDRSLIVGELGGPFSRASRELQETVNIKETVALTLADHRKADQKKDDSGHGHTVLTGDMFFTSFNEVENQGLMPVRDWIKKTGKLDLLIVRLGGLTQNFNKKHGAIEPEFFTVFFLHSFLKWYELLSEDGTMLVVCPGNTEEKIKEFVSKINSNFERPVLEVEINNHQYKDGSDNPMPVVAIRLRRLIGSPQKIILADLIGDSGHSYFGGKKD